MSKGWFIPPKSPQEALDRMQQVAWRIDAITGIPNALLVFLRLEELALAGDSKAMTLYVERAFGKMPEQLQVKLDDYKDKTDEELLKTFTMRGNQEAIYRLLKVADANLTTSSHNYGKKLVPPAGVSVRVVDDSDNPQPQAKKRRYK
jgi:hypothetical protein